MNMSVEWISCNWWWPYDKIWPIECNRECCIAVPGNLTWKITNVFYFFWRPAAWNVNVMLGTLATIMDHEYQVCAIGMAQRQDWRWRASKDRRASCPLKVACMSTHISFASLQGLAAGVTALCKKAAHQAGPTVHLSICASLSLYLEWKVFLLSHGRIFKKSFHWGSFFSLISRQEEVISGQVYGQRQDRGCLRSSDGPSFHQRSSLGPSLERWCVCGCMCTSVAQLSLFS